MTRRTRHTPGTAVALLALLAATATMGGIEMVHTCVRCVCECTSSPCDPPSELPGPCALEDATVEAFGGVCNQACASGGALGKLVVFQTVDTHCPPCPVSAGRAAAPAAGTAGLGALAVVLFGSGAWLLRARRPAG